MGRNIVRRSHRDEPQRHSRLWVKEEIEDILTNDLGTQETKCLYFDSWDFSVEIAIKGLAKMKDLRFIHIALKRYFFGSNIVQFDKISEYLPNSLRFMGWIGFPFSSLPNTFQGKYLVELDLCFSNIVQLWEDGEEKVLPKLRFLRIERSELRTFDLRLAPNLERLNIENSGDFVELHMPAESVKLEYLNLSHLKLKSLRLRNTPSLKKLILEGCNDLVELQMPAESLKLEHLDLSHSKLRTLDLGLTPNLKQLHLANCYDFVEINAPIGCLKNLLVLDLRFCGRFKSFVFDKWSQPVLVSLSELHLIAEPTYVCLLHPDNDSPKFRFECYYKEDPASSFGILERLISTGLCACINLESFSRSIFRSLQCLRKLKLEGSISKAPKDLDRLECLEELTFSSTEIKNLPDSICMLKHLKSLKLKSYLLLEKLPDDLGQLESLETLILTDCKLLQFIPNSICKMKCINYLGLRGCIRVVELPEDIGCLEGLKELDIVGTGVTRLPQSIFQLRGLHIVGSIRLVDTYGLYHKRRRTYDDEILCCLFPSYYDETVYYI